MNNFQGMKNMTDIERLAAQSMSVWEEWNGLGVSGRRALLGAWAENVSQRGGDFAFAAQMIRFHLQQAETLLEPVHDMPGPTGETNELYTAGRGLFLVTGDESLTLSGLAGQLTAALVAGNCALVAVANVLRHETDALLADLVKASAPNRLVLTTEFEKLDDVLQQAPIFGVAAIASEKRLIEINRILASREGVLVQFVAESNVEQLPLIASPTYLLRFITERTRTINITAVGGNATLLELGSGEH
ncbi:delta 1-pyrroline-5-carboxylate dehydrogenase [Enterovibrio makurazakiensis]|uniref:Delta 1-pyrroline-5-carboxylate dehydrogenase n=1 Tax=Enterovibrio gelatinilyticus TaxID=2899819 RepID=A0ABT5R656_9GAMM|nr:delta 1-pyrroline-5-carboxylate dehydrogenase [Enterovibrio sp. ZSDZ42]MDD1795763.1 delta 1-pyrroline-5-carboxylate dehydrogenase [Enterovibrio sp. ZSDZ42]